MRKSILFIILTVLALGCSSKGNRIKKRIDKLDYDLLSSWIDKNPQLEKEDYYRYAVQRKYEMDARESKTKVNIKTKKSRYQKQINISSLNGMSLLELKNIFPALSLEQNGLVMSIKNWNTWEEIYFSFWDSSCERLISISFISKKPLHESEIKQILEKIFEVTSLEKYEFWKLPSGLILYRNLSHNILSGIELIECNLLSGNELFMYTLHKTFKPDEAFGVGNINFHFDRRNNP